MKRNPLDNEVARLTNGCVQYRSQVARLKEWLVREGCPPFTSLDRKAVKGLLARQDLPKRVRQVLKLRATA
jgi:hypothetical protein